MQHLYATKQHLWEPSNESYMVFNIIIKVIIKFVT